MYTELYTEKWKTRQTWLTWEGQAEGRKPFGMPEFQHSQALTVFERKTLITRRSEVRILPPLLLKHEGLASRESFFILHASQTRLGPGCGSMSTALTSAVLIRAGITSRPLLSTKSVFLFSPLHLISSCLATGRFSRYVTPGLERI